MFITIFLYFVFNRYPSVLSLKKYFFQLYLAFVINVVVCFNVMYYLFMFKVKENFIIIQFLRFTFISILTLFGYLF